MFVSRLVLSAEGQDGGLRGGGRLTIPLVCDILVCGPEANRDVEGYEEEEKRVVDAGLGDSR